MPIVCETGDSHQRYRNMHKLDRHISIFLLGLTTFIEAQICDLDCGTGYSCVLRRSTCIYPPCPSFPTCSASNGSEQQSDKFASHPGQCPNSTTSGPCIGTCRVDTDCLHRQKCCENDCGRTCRPIINSTTQQKSGSCARRLEMVSGTCQSNCATDYDCPGVQKCCSNGCASLCSDPCFYWLGQNHHFNKIVTVWKLPFICRS